MDSYHNDVAAVKTLWLKSYTIYLNFWNKWISLLNDNRYHLKDVIVGKIYFLLVRIKIKHMEIAIIKRETTGSGKCCALCSYT